jgi:hypothetical protein
MPNLVLACPLGADSVLAVRSGHEPALAVRRYVRYVADAPAGGLQLRKGFIGASIVGHGSAHRKLRSAIKEIKNGLHAKVSERRIVMVRDNPVSDHAGHKGSEDVQ